jgi:hypothetical protein
MSSRTMSWSTPWTKLSGTRNRSTASGLRAVEASAGGRAQLLGDSTQGCDAALYVGATDGVAFAHRSHQLARRAGGRRSGCRMGAHGDLHRLRATGHGVEPSGESGGGRFEIIELRLQVGDGGRRVVGGLGLVPQAGGRELDG